MPKSVRKNRVALADGAPSDLFERLLGPTANKLAEEVKLEFNSNPFRQFDRRVLVATSGGRVGSHVLLQGLLAYGIKVNEYFNVDTITNTCARRGIASLEEYCDYRLEKTANAGAFGVKGKVHILLPLWKSGEVPGHFADWVIVYLYRKDVVRQAVSEVKAQISGSWRSAQAPTREVTDRDYNGKRIAKNIDKILDAEEAWEAIFSTFELNTLKITYEDLAREPASTVKSVAEFAKLSGPPLEQTSPPVEVQADELNDRWTARFKAENSDFDYGRGSAR